MFFLGTLLGTLGSGLLIERFGPKRTAMAASTFLLAAIAIQVSTETKVQLLIGKVSMEWIPLATRGLTAFSAPPDQLCAGISLGTLSVTASNFISEASPSKLRGPLSAAVGMAGIIGIVLGITTGSQVIGHVEPTGWKSWRLTLAMVCTGGIPLMAV